MVRWQRGLWLFCLPSFGLLAIVLLWPLCYAIYLSFFDYYLGSDARQFIGIGNYVSLLTEARLWNSIGTTVIIAFGSVGLEFALGLALALALYRIDVGSKVFSALLFLPHIVTPVVATLFLKWILASNWGLVDATMISIGLEPPDWLGSPVWAKVSVILADAWIFTPLIMMVLYAALQGLDNSLVEAAKIDGANNWRVLRHVIIPALIPAIIFTISVRLMDVFRFFDTIYVLTGGGPGTATETVTMYTYQLGFRMLEVGKASALGVITLIIVAALLLTINRVLTRIYRKGDQ
ncbi:multiple sugar transport system permease protein [Ochrobactrum daejeonense]|uniref:Multiple sugar transport system permease protein n=1 Tax=Brucella daejeonensis TaxID=659015 RepID=A0A7W9AVG8_9HYPH|nr:sugar ABC transporter permease [Brucella daejeonensis]MBB5701261.1 multiple sugar transport system permease protein [Brucella daejeonensis]